MTEKETFTDFEIEQLKYKRNFNYGLSQIKLISKIVLYSSFGMVLITLITIIYGILNNLGVVWNETNN